jgi:glycolate oxidase iron-sulfur subunit
MSEPPRPPLAFSTTQRNLLMTEYANALACVRCGLCLTSCPTYVLTLHEAESPRGRIAMARALAEGRLDLTPELVARQQSCLVCDACSAVCPAGVHMEPLQIALRAAIAPSATGPIGRGWLRRFIFRGVFGDMRVFRVAVRLLWLYQRLGLRWLAQRTGSLRLLRLGEADALLPSLPSRFLVPRGEVYPAPREAAADAPATVAFFAGCVMSTALAEIDRATVRVLQRAGCEVVDPEGQGCCGALHAHGGDRDTARRLARHTIAAFERSGELPIIVNSAGCGAMLKDYAHLLRDDPAWAARGIAFSARVRDVTEFLAERALPMAPQPAVRVAFQDPCHLLHAQRISRQPRVLLRQIPGIELVEMAEAGLCCGSAGAYNLTNPDESHRLQQRKLDHIAATGAEVLVTANPGCLLQLRAGLAARGSAMRVKHIVELLDEASTPPPAGAGATVG